MKILFLSFYFPPDLCAGSFRAGALLDALLAAMPEDTVIEMITTLPNRYSSFNSQAKEVEVGKHVCIHRIKLPLHKSGMLDQAKAFLSYALGVIRLVRRKEYDIVISTSSRLMTAALGALISRKKSVPLYLDIRDIFVDTMQDVLPATIARLTYPFFTAIERFTLNRAGHVNLVSAGFEQYFKDRYPELCYSFHTNGIDDEFVSSGKPDDRSAGFKEHNVSGSPLLVVYAGNIGEGQGLHLIIPKLADCLKNKVHFRIIGDGGRRAQLEKSIKDAGCLNVELLPPMKREQLIEEYRRADILFLHLNDYDAFKKVLPSKLFEYAAMGKPVWAGISGYSAQFAKEEITNSAVFHPCDHVSAASTLASLKLEYTPRPDFVGKYLRTHIMKNMAREIVAMLPQRPEE